LAYEEIAAIGFADKAICFWKMDFIKKCSKEMNIEENIEGNAEGKKEFLWRFCTPGDVPWMVELAEKKFNFVNPQHANDFLINAVKNPNAIIVRTENVCIGVMCYEFPYNRQFIMAEDLFFASDSKYGWEFYFLLKEVLKKMKEIGVCEFKFDVSAFSKIGKNLSPIAKRIGAEKLESHYSIKFKTLH
jgi:hypothetical protein